MEIIDQVDLSNRKSLGKEKDKDNGHPWLNEQSEAAAPQHSEEVSTVILQKLVIRSYLLC